MIQTDITYYEFFHQLKRLSFIDEIWLYGSRARGDAHKLSDIDMAIVCPRASEEEWEKIRSVVGQADTLLAIDLVRFDRLPLEDKFRESIEKYKKVLFKRGSDYMDKEFWKDSFDSLGSALERLEDVLHSKDKHVDFWKDTVIQRFEFSFELYWKTLKRFLAFENVDVADQLPRGILQKAFQHGLIDDEGVWIKMLIDRNKTSHLYREIDATEIFENIQALYCSAMQQTYKRLKERF
jgi:nucleotidyltransferase substrate binding protein (TIGR01987 family)